MPDLEKVIENLEKAKTIIEEWIPMFEQYNTPAGIDDAIDMLKAKEAKPMTEYDDGWDCPRCGLKLVGKTASGYPCDEFDLPDDEIVKYCPVCGQAVKWNDIDGA